MVRENRIISNYWDHRLLLDLEKFLPVYFELSGIVVLVVVSWFLVLAALLYSFKTLSQAKLSSELLIA